MNWATVQYMPGIHFFVVDTKTAKPFLARENKRVVCAFDDASKIHASILTKKELDY